MRALVIGLAALLIVAGCAENPVTGRREFVVVSEEQAIESSAVAYREMMGQLEKKKQVEIAVYSGMWETLKATDEELPQVLGHEIGHAIAAHTRERISIAIGIELAARAGFDPQAAVTLWEKMGRQGATPPEFLSTHPSPANRRERLQALATKLEPVYRAAKRG